MDLLKLAGWVPAADRLAVRPQAHTQAGAAWNVPAFPLRARRPCVLVTFGTLVDDSEIVPAVLASPAALEVNVLLTVGPAGDPDVDRARSSRSGSSAARRCGRGGLRGRRRHGPWRARRGRLAQLVRDGAISPPDLAGATFTVSNLGMFAMTSISPVINGGQAAILGVGVGVGVGATREALVRRDGGVVDLALMTLTLNADHRIL